MYPIDPIKHCGFYKEHGCSHVDGMYCNPQCGIAYEYQQLKFTEDMHKRIDEFFATATDDELCEMLIKIGNPSCLKCKAQRCNPNILVDYADCKLSRKFTIKID